VKIADVARRFADQHVPPLEIVYTGLRPGEKLHEDLIADGESGERPFHPMITHVAADAATVEEISEIRDSSWAEAFRRPATPLGGQPASTPA
jgi:FlaA1/EpsC-like NDP-sugar epimerase